MLAFLERPQVFQAKTPIHIYLNEPMCMKKHIVLLLFGKPDYK